MKSTTNKKTRVYNILREKIIKNELPQGMPVNEAEFAQQLGVSKTPVRESLLQLEREGFVENIPGRGAIISYITSREINEIFQIREILESGVVKTVATIKGNEELAKIREEYKRMLNSGESALQEIPATGTFEDMHLAIIEALDNHALTNIYTGLLDRIKRIRSYYGKKFSQKRLEDILIEHLEIMDAVFEGDTAAADEKMRLHLRHAASFLTGLDRYGL